MQRGGDSLDDLDDAIEDALEHSNDDEDDA
jgi:hypothetical protein